jgi:hypothetical protein
MVITAAFIAYHLLWYDHHVAHRDTTRVTGTLAA